jgi:MYXO-CTERM domain-containing protein
MIALLLLLACEDTERSGTAVGNPGTLGSTASALPEEATLDSARLSVAGVTLEDCEGGLVDLPAAAEVELLDPAEALAELPGGSWCGLTAEISGLALSGVTDGGAAFTAELAPDPLSAGAFSVDGGWLLLGVPLTVDAEAIEALGDEVTLASDDPLTLAWAEAATAGADLWDDSDGDGLIAQGELSLSEATASVGDMAAAESAGCSAASGRAAWWLALALALAPLRRRPARPSPRRLLQRGAPQPERWGDRQRYLRPKP